MLMFKYHFEGICFTAVIFQTHRLCLPHAVYFAASNFPNFRVFLRFSGRGVVIESNLEQSWTAQIHIAVKLQQTSVIILDGIDGF